MNKKPFKYTADFAVRMYERSFEELLDNLLDCVERGEKFSIQTKDLNGEQVCITPAQKSPASIKIETEKHGIGYMSRYPGRPFLK